ncbi:MAG: insulinase family protein [Bacteroidetes bacterium]|nr:insulinase family protein [Bacteroidota bacterium]
MKRISVFFTIVLLAVVSQLALAQMDPKAPLPNDESVRHGVLDNGMTYYIKANQEPKERASFYIIQNVGALLEDDHQDGLAHFLEHMAFNGTEHFEGKGIINTLERHGVAFGADINAGTGQDHTVYMLMNVPATKPGLIDTCLLILNDWSNYLLLTEEEIDAERGVIKEEWRTRRTAQWRLQQGSMPYFFPNSKYAERDVIGSLDVIENFEYDALRDFYHKWYRTDLQAIAIAGDFDADEMETKVKELFSKIPAVKNPSERPMFEIPDQEAPLFGVVTDKEASQTFIQYLVRHKKETMDPESLLDHRESYIQNLFSDMMGQRVNELLQKGDPPFVFGAVSYGDFVTGYEIFSMYLSPKPNEEALGLGALLTEVERAKRYGFTQSELERAKAEILTRWEKKYNERDKISNDEYIQDYIGNYLFKNAYLSAEQGYKLVQALLPTITVEDFNVRMKEWMSSENQSLVIQGPEGEEHKHLTEAEAMAVFHQIAAAEIEPYEEEELAESLVSEELAPAVITSIKNLEQFDAVEWTLENGARVVFRHADYEKDQVQIRGYSVGGGSLFDNEYVPSVDMLINLTSFYGVGEFDATSLQKMLTGKSVEFNMQLGNLNEGVVGKATPKDMETMMQLLYLSFSQPRFDEPAHEAIMARYDALVANMGNNPQKIMGDSMNLILTNYHPRTRVLDMDFLGDIEFKMIEEVYRDRFADASDFFFVIVGNVEEEQLKPLVQKYIGAIPDLDRTETWVNRKILEPQGVVARDIELSLETPKANVNIVINQPMSYKPYNRQVMNVIEGILELRFTESIREEEGGTYGVRIGTNLQRLPAGKANMKISFDCDPDRADDLKAKVFLELDKLAQEGPSTEDLSKTVGNMLKNREQSKEHNSYYLNTIYGYYIHGINYDDPANYEDILNGLSTKDVKKVMKAFYKKPNIVDVVFKPLPTEE